MEQRKLINYIHLLEGTQTDYDPLLAITKDARFVLIGEATHGTEEFYSIRADITKQLIVEQGFNAIAIEGDWPDTYNINRYIHGDKEIKNSIDALRGFKRFPTWMWRNNIIVEFIDWLWNYNSRQKEGKMVSFYGLDLYCQAPNIWSNSKLAIS